MAVLKGSDNPFPSILLQEHVDPATPPSGHWRLFVDTDNILKIIDDAGTVSAVGGASGSVATDAIFDAKGDLAVGTGSNTSAKLTVGANDTIPMADSGQSTGIKWVASQTPSTQAFSDAAAEGTADTYARGDHKHAMPASPGGGGALVFLEAHTASNSANLSFTTFYSSTYDDYLVELVDIQPATDNVDLKMVYSTDGGSSYVAGTAYYSAHSGPQNAGSTAGGNLNGGAYYMLGTGVDNASDRSFNATLYLHSLASTSLGKHVHGTVMYSNQSFVLAATFMGVLLNNTAMNAVRFLFSSGNISTGTIRIYGLSKT